MPTVSSEGWGLYSEFLGHEMGLYDQDKLSEFGFYSFNLLRACRLVVDTGLHAMNWTREEAVNFMKRHGLDHWQCEAALAGRSREDMEMQFSMEMEK